MITKRLSLQSFFVGLIFLASGCTHVPPPTVSPPTPLQVGETIWLYHRHPVDEYGSNKFTIDHDGTITLAVAGKVKIEGLTPDEAASHIQNVFKEKNIFRRPEIFAAFIIERSERKAPENKKK